MSKPSKRGGAARLLFLALLLPLPALCGVSAVDSTEPPQSRPADTGKPAAGTYQIRCWQLGRLLFEENRIALPPDIARNGLRLHATDRHGKPIYLADTANATCLIRTMDDERAWPRDAR